MRLLLNHGADVDVQDKQGRTALQYAREKKSVLAVKEFEANAQSRSQRSALLASPYAPYSAALDTPDSDGLLKPIFHQCMLMVRDGILRDYEVEECTTVLRSMGLTRGLMQLKSFEASVRGGYGGNRSLVQALGVGASVRQEGVWQGLRDGKPFGFIKARSETIWVHRNQVRDVDSLERGTVVVFELGYRNDRPEAQNVCAAAQAGPSMPSLDVIWVTNGSLNPPVPPVLLMLTREEAAVMVEFGAQVQVHDNPFQPFVDKHFAVPSPACGLPPASEIFSAAAYAKAHASEVEAKALGDTKSLLDEKDIVVWKQHTAKTLITGDVVKSLRKEKDPEMCTKAFAKMYEMLCAYDLVAPRRDTDAYNTLHVCEAPGAFICATNHYIKSRFPHLKWNWRACSLNPYFEGNNTDAMVDDDAFINETPNNWYFGCDDTGDMRLRENIEGAIAEAKKMGGPLLLVTADGSVDCSDVPNEQEEFTAQLHYCETVAALGALDIGGCFVLKMFMLFEHSSIGLIYLLSCLFQDVSVCKPVMSTPGNSETYIISRGFKGIDESVMSALLENTGKEWPTDENGNKKALIPFSSMPSEWMDKMIECGRYFSQLQGSVIKRNLRLFDEFTREEGQSVSQARATVSSEWMRRYKIQRIDRSQRIVSAKTLQGNRNHLGAEGRKRDAGSLAERTDLKDKRNSIREGDGDSNDLDSAGVERGLRRLKATDGSAVTDHMGEETMEKSPGSIERENEKGVGGTNSVESQSQPGAGEPYISDFARKQMEKMGHKSGEGLGKSGQGIKAPIQATVKKDFRAGISYGGCNEIQESRIAVLEPSDLLWIENRIVTVLIGDALLQDESCIKEGKKLNEYQMSKFCAQRIVLDLLEERSNLNRALAHNGPESYKQTLKQSLGCYMVGNAGFVSRAAIKMADINRLCLDLFADLKGDKVSFVDIYGGRGGFSDYALWKLGPLATKSWIIDRKQKLSPDTGKFKAAALWMGSDSASVPLETYGSQGKIDAACLSELEALILNAKESNVQYVFGDGVVKLESVILRSKESVSTKLLLCQCIVAIETLSEGGCFICRITDLLGRCTIGTVLVLATLFDKITCMKPEMSCPVKSERFLVCLGFLGREKAASSALHMRTIVSRIESISDSSKDIVAFVPQKYLMDSSFASALIKMNERDCKQEILYGKYINSLLQSKSDSSEGMDLDVDEFLERLKVKATS